MPSPTLLRVGSGSDATAGGRPPLDHMSRFKTFAAACWASAGAALVIPGFVAQARWEAPFSWWDNNISELGEVSAPWHVYANASFVVTGVLLAVGVLAFTRGVARLLLLAGSD